MSAIWGAVNLTGGEIAKEEIRLLKAAFAKCRIDRYERYVHSIFIWAVESVFCATGKRGAITLHGVRYLLYGGCCAG